ncbi:hypothetical protein [Halomonas sp. PA16-9]|uniref:hypothetical protein n=1 Tax=Halomonas sp. PA16-9 TaxID=2576841 RepID=UPI0030EB736F
MHSTNTTSRRQLLKWRPIHGVMIALALIAPLVLTAWLGGAEALQRVKHFPLGLLLLMLVMAFLCWNLNAARLRFDAGWPCGQARPARRAGIELASKFALCATQAAAVAQQPCFVACAARFPACQGRGGVPD